MTTRRLSTEHACSIERLGRQVDRGELSFADAVELIRQACVDPRPTDRNLSVAFSVDEVAVLHAMQRATGCASHANLVRTALWSLAEFLRVDLPSGVFDLRENRDGGRRTRNPKIRLTA